MIVSVGEEFLRLTEEQKELDALEMIDILKHGHYLTMEPRVQKNVTDFIVEHLLPSHKRYFEDATEYIKPAKMMKRWLHTISFYAFNKEQRDILLQKPSELLVENAPNEWPIYKNICQAYSKDDSYSSIFKYLARAVFVQKGVIGVQAGGKTEIPAMIDFKNLNEFKGLYKYKVLVLFDRDTNDANSFAEDNKNLFIKLAHKTNVEITDDDIYKLDFGDDFIWHSWYKRAIENYFPKEEYIKLGLDMSDYPNDENKYDYTKFPIESTKEWKDTHKSKKDKKKDKYEKKMMQNIGKDMEKSDYEKNLKTFNIDGNELSEFQLFLLKLAKIA